MRPFFALKTPLLLYPFRFFDPVMGRWVRARYLAERHEIEARYTQWEIIGPPELRARGYAAMFSPWGRSPDRAHLPPVEDPPPDHGPTPDPPPVEQPPPVEDQLERFLVLLFLRRYVTYCARRKSFAQMNGAARLFKSILPAGQ